MSDTLTAEQVREILARADAAVPGPWFVVPPILKDDDPGHWNIPIRAPNYHLPAHCYGAKYRAANAVFIASVRTDVPALCLSWLARDAELAALRERVGQLTAALERTCQRWTFDNHQQHTHTWHDWADCVPGAKQLLAQLARGRGDAGNTDRRMT